MNHKTAVLLLIVATGLSACKPAHAPTDLAKANLIPRPTSITATAETFALTEKSGVVVSSDSPELLKIGKYLSDKLKPATGFELAVTTSKEKPGKGNIYLVVANGDAALGEEGYELTITADLVQLQANQPAGLFRGIQTLRQLLPDRIERQAVQKGPWEIATGTIKDHPRFAFRGAMLDLGRHFFGVNDIKRYIDLIAAYKLNKLHLHLSDDQGWRIEIKSWPHLTAHGGSTEVGGGHGGFLTQEEYKDIVQYAADRYIVIIPEIDTPGHTNAALASYPELNCNGKAPALYTGIEVGFSTLCAQKDITYKFMNDVVGELAAITPGPWIHIGGDESHATKKEDYILYINKVQDIVQAHGKQMIGWDEISQSTIKPGTVAQFWSNAKFAKSAADQGAKMIISPAKKIYVDMSYDSTIKLGQHWAAYIEVDSAYQWDPANYVKGIDESSILGIESPLWTETITKMKDIEFMVFPRLVGYSEIGWSLGERNWGEYRVRLGKHGSRLDAMDIGFYRSKLVQWGAADSAAQSRN